MLLLRRLYFIGLRSDNQMVINETLKIIQQRRSIRSFQEGQIKEEELQAILEAGYCAPYAWNNSRHFTIVQDKLMLEKLNLAAKEAASLMDMAHLKALGNNEKYNCLYGAPTLIIISGDENAPIPLNEDCAAATQNLLLAAESIGLGSCWSFFVTMAFFSSKGSELRKILIPEGYKPYDAAVFGYKKAGPTKVREMKFNSITYIK
jgi:nitroreductase